ncbi:MAG: hypothetical protein PUP91_12860 [Rhizonema sp. PD37]|nr:hypothetical protein [Rhizonema sp. PD37]
MVLDSCIDSVAGKSSQQLNRVTVAVKSWSSSKVRSQFRLIHKNKYHYGFG